MAEIYSFFDPVTEFIDDKPVPDRKYNAQQFTDYFKTLVTTGVMKGAGNMLAVSANGSNMITSLNTGIAFIEGRYYLNDAPLQLTHDTETLGNNRIDRIVIRMDLSTELRFVKAFIKKGAASTNPVPPTLTQTPNLYEISVAQVKIVGGQTYIATNAVTDERGTDIICPYVGSKILPNFDNAALEQMVNDFNTHLTKKASTTQEGHVRLNDTLTSTSTTEAATANTVRQVNDRLKYFNIINRYSINIGQGAKGNLAIGVDANNTEIGGTGFAIGWQAVATGMNGSALGGFATSINVQEGVIGTATATTDGSNRWRIPGTLSVTGTKNFEIPHPHPNKKHTHVIRHGAVESPTTGDTLYRYSVEATTDGEVVEIQLPDYFEYLNTNVDVWVNPHLHFGRAFGIVEGDKLKVTCEKAGVYKTLVIGTRNDDNVQDWYIKGAEREIGESWLGETYVFEVDELTEVTEFEEVLQ